MATYMNSTFSFVFVCFVRITVAKQPRPNILFILADDLGWNDVGYHQSDIKTPTIDKLAAGGVRLENYYVQPICTPSRSQLLSGRYQIHTGLQHSVILSAQPWGLRPEFPTIAEQLQQAGYSTHIVGKWHLGFFKSNFLPTRRGFNTSFGYYCGAEDYYKHDVGAGEMYGIDFHQDDRPFNASGSYSTHLFVQRAEQVIKDHVTSNASKSKPLFLYVPFQAVHIPLQVPESYLLPYKHIVDQPRRHFAAMVSCLDEAVANLTTALKKHRLWDNTVLIFSTDNGGPPTGGANNWPLRGAKNTYWEGGLRGVGFVHSSLLKHKGEASMEFMHISDWFPTLLHLAGGSTAGLELDGYNMWNTISEGAPSPRKDLLHNIDPLTPLKGDLLPWSPFDNRVTAAVRVGPWKLLTGDPGDGSWVPPPHYEQQSRESLTSAEVQFRSDDSTSSVYRMSQSQGLEKITKPEPKNKNIWLFNIAVDPLEKTDLSDDRPDIVADLLLRLASFNATAVPVFWRPDDPRASPHLHRGYWRPWMD